MTIAYRISYSSPDGGGTTIINSDKLLTLEDGLNLISEQMQANNLPCHEITIKEFRPITNVLDLVITHAQRFGL